MTDHAPADGADPGGRAPTARRTVLYELHARHGGRFGPFAGWDMPIRYGPGPIAEHEQCRNAAALFDVSHMTVLDVQGATVLDDLERLVPADLHALAPGQIKYSFFTDDRAGILDDVMITKRGDDRVRLVLNAATTEDDLDYLAERLPAEVQLTPRRDLALVALQGPRAEPALARLDPSVADLRFMHEGTARLQGHRVELSRSGYTGGDGFELALPADAADALVEAILAQPEVALAGLAARDSLRLEAGVCLYGHDLDPDTTPVEAGLLWAIPKARRVADAGYRGAAVVARQITDGPPRRRVGLRPLGRRPVREGAQLELEGRPVGRVTSGGYSPLLAAPIAMGYLERAVTDRDDASELPIEAVTNGRSDPCRIVPMPFIAKDYRR